MNNVQKIPKAAPSPGGFISERAADVIAVGTSVLASAATAWGYVQRSAYKNMSSLGAFEDMKPRRKKDFDGIEQLLEEGKITPAESFKRVDALVETNEREAVRRLEKMGIKTFSDRWHILRGHQKVETAAFALIAGGVAIGAILPLLREGLVKKSMLAEPMESQAK